MTYLLVWNVKRWHWFDDLAETLAARGGRHRGNWSSGANTTMPRGARVFLVRVGAEPRGIVASGVTTSARPYRERHWDEALAKQGRKAWYVGVAFDRILNPAREAILTIPQLKAAGLGHVNWTPQGSGIRLAPDVADQLGVLWRKFLRSGVHPVLSFPEAAVEGARTEIKTYSRGRSRRLRDGALQDSKGVCEACCVDYNGLLDGKGVRVLQVHHRQQLGATDKPRLTRATQLAVLCANCHCLVHMNPRKALSVQTLRSMLRESRGA